MKRILLLSLTLLISAITFAQGGINYKALIKDTNGDVIASQAIIIQFQILEDGTTNVYQETHNPTTDVNGIIIVNIGEGTVDSGNFSIIDWGADDHFLNVQINTGSGLIDLGTTQFNSVPYAIVAETVKNAPFEKVGDLVRHTNDGDFLFGARALDYTSSSVETKFFFNSDTQAFRGGKIANDNWDAANLGDYSFAYGLFNKVTGDGSVSFGLVNDISGARAFAHGGSNILTGFGNVVFGEINNVSGAFGLSVGYQNTSTFDYSNQIGQNLVSGRAFQTVLGQYNNVSSTAMFQIGNGDFNTTNTLFSIEDDGAIISDFYEGTGERLLAADANGKLISTTFIPHNPSLGLERITEGGFNGWRLVGKNPLQYGDIGNLAVDLSTAIGTASTDYGATGATSFAAGNSTKASGPSSFAMGYQSEATGSSSAAIGYRTIANAFGGTAVGTYNTGGGTGVNNVTTNPVFQVGNGNNENARSNALTVLRDGTITAPSFDIVKITDDKALITKEYLEANSATGLELLTEAGKTGFRISERDPAFYGDIGTQAVDLSSSFSSAADYGATGNYSFAGGFLAEAVGDYSVSFSGESSGFESLSIGRGSRASGQNAIALGRRSFADKDYSVSIGGARTNGIYSIAIGFLAESDAAYSNSFGRFNVGGGDPNNWVETDPLFEIGNGTGNFSNRSNALTVLKNGNIGVNKHTDISSKLEIETNSTNTHAHLALIEDNNSYARIKFKNTNRNGDDYWDIAGYIGATQADDRLNFFNSDGGDILSIEGDGDVRVNGSVVHSSDRRLKRDIETIDFGIAEILKLNPVQYNWKDKADKTYKSLGVIAQEIEEIIPNVVQIGNDTEQTLSVSYTELIPVLIKAIQEQQEIIDSQNEKYASLEKIVLSLAAKVERNTDTNNSQQISAEK